MMSTVTGPEHRKQLVRMIVEEMFNKGRLEVSPEIFAPDFVDRGHESMAEKTGGPDGFAAFVRAVRIALPEISKRRFRPWLPKAITSPCGTRQRQRTAASFSESLRQESRSA
jgi:hypothetical protein